MIAAGLVLAPLVAYAQSLGQITANWQVSTNGGPNITPGAGGKVNYNAGCKVSVHVAGMPENAWAYRISVYSEGVFKDKWLQDLQPADNVKHRSDNKYRDTFDTDKTLPVSDPTPVDYIKGIFSDYSTTDVYAKVIVHYILKGKEYEYSRLIRTGNIQVPNRTVTEDQSSASFSLDANGNLTISQPLPAGGAKAQANGVYKKTWTVKTNAGFLDRNSTRNRFDRTDSPGMAT